MNPILEIRDLEVTFRVGPMMRRQDIQAVAGVSFEVRPGETLRWSESGSGKTTWPARPTDAADLERLGPFDGQPIDGRRHPP